MLFYHASVYVHRETISRKLVCDIAKAFGRGNARQVKTYRLFSLERLALANPSHVVKLGAFKYPVITEEYSLIDGRERLIQMAHFDDLFYSEKTSGWLLIDDADAEPYDPIWTELIGRIMSANTKQVLHKNGETFLMLNVRFGKVERGTFTALRVRINHSTLHVISVEPDSQAKTDVVVALTPNSNYPARVVQAPSELTSIWSEQCRGSSYTGLVVMQLEEGAIISVAIDNKFKWLQWKNRRFVNCTPSKSSRSKTE